MSKVSSSTSKSSSSRSAKGLSGKGAAKTGGGGKAGKSARVKGGLGKVSGGKSTKAGGSKSMKGKTGKHKSEKSGEMQNPFKQLGNFLGNVLGTGGGTEGVKGSSGRKSGGSKATGRSGSGKSQRTGRNQSAGKSQRTGRSQSAGKSQRNTAGSQKTGSKDSVKKSQSETGQKPSAGQVKGQDKPSAEQVKGQEKTSSGQDGKVMGTAKGTGYYPHNSKMEGGYLDKKGNKLTTVQDVLDGKAKSAAIALDKNLYKSGQVKYGDSFTIPEMDKKYGKHIDFRAVDTGGAFTNKGFSRVDICTGSKKDSLDPTVNGKLTLIKNPDALQGQKATSPDGVKAIEQNKPTGVGNSSGDPASAAKATGDPASAAKATGDPAAAAKATGDPAAAAKATGDSAAVAKATGDPAAAAKATGDPAAGKLNVPWYSQFDGKHVPDAGKKACFRASKAMAQAAGGKVLDVGNRIQIATGEDKRGRISVNSDKARQGVNRINSQLSNGKPVVVGVSYKDSNYNADKVTDHFVTITGKGTDQNGKTYYTFHDPGTRHGSAGKDTSSNNRFYVDEATGKLYRPGSDGSGMAGKRYEVSMVR